MDGALILCRFAHFSAAMFLWGGAVFGGWLVPDAMRPVLASYERRVFPALVLVVVATSLLWLGLEAGIASDGWAAAFDPATIAALLDETDFGRVWTLRLLIAAGLAASLFLRGRPARAGRMALAGLMLASLGLVGHAEMRDGAQGVVQRAIATVHLVAAGFWLGSLPPLVVCLRRTRQGPVAGPLADTLRRFSGLGHLAVALVLATGAANAWLILGHWPIDTASPYQRLLDLKVAAVALMMLIAVANRYLLVPRSAGRALVTGTLAELALGALALGLVSAFATFDPV